MLNNTVDKSKTSLFAIPSHLFFSISILVLAIIACNSFTNINPTPAPSSTPPPTPTPAPQYYELQINGPTTATISVKTGDFVWVVASGEISFGMFAGKADADGLTNVFLQGYNKEPSLPHGALLCWINNEDYQFCGIEREFIAQSSGTLHLDINDNDTGNNLGVFEVQIVVSKYSIRTQVMGEAPSSPSSNSSTYSLTVINDTESSICYLYISPDTSDDWGQDQLGTDNTVEPGNSFEIYGISQGVYDLKAVACGTDSETVRNDLIFDQDLTWTLSNQ